jgi:putative oxidoreductase
MYELAHTIGCVLLGGVFVWAGIDHFLRFKEVVQQLTDRGFPAPAPMLAAGSVVEVVAGLGLALGIERPLAAAVLILFTIAASVLALNFWRYTGPERDGMRSAFIINIAVIGGLMVAGAAEMW